MKSMQNLFIHNSYVSCIEKTFDTWIHKKVW
jgi:hypothetical protein